MSMPEPAIAAYTSAEVTTPVAFTAVNPSTF